jgi:uncharacterized membrane protein
MLVVVFDSESKAYQGSRALAQLDAEGSIAIHAESVIKKNDDGTVTVKQFDGDFPVRTVGGAAIGSLLGVLGGPVGMGVGAAAGALAGSIGDLHVAGVGAEFLDQVTAALAPGKCAVLADISEEWVTPVDTRMEALGGTVVRTPRKSFENEQRVRVSRCFAPKSTGSRMSMRGLARTGKPSSGLPSTNSASSCRGSSTKRS